MQKLKDYLLFYLFDEPLGIKMIDIINRLVKISNDWTKISEYVHNHTSIAN